MLESLTKGISSVIDSGKENNWFCPKAELTIHLHLQKLRVEIT
jgi:hypothetical protein